LELSKRSRDSLARQRPRRDNLGNLGALGVKHRHGILAIDPFYSITRSPMGHAVIHLERIGQLQVVADHSKRPSRGASKRSGCASDVANDWSSLCPVPQRIGVSGNRIAKRAAVNAEADVCARDAEVVQDTNGFGHPVGADSKPLKLLIQPCLCGLSGSGVSDLGEESVGRGQPVVFSHPRQIVGVRWQPASKTQSAKVVHGIQGRIPHQACRLGSATGRT
jgi:hypothetical protein